MVGAIRAVRPCWICGWLAEGVSSGVVSDAYAQLEGQGLLVSRTRAAPLVASVQAPTLPQAPPEVEVPLPRYDSVRRHRMCVSFR
jgi:DNA-binding transcriptional MocR family regulator